MIYVGLRDAILGVLESKPVRDWPLQKLYAAVASSRVITKNDLKSWGGQLNLHHRVRSELAKLVNQGLVRRPRYATYRLA